MSNYFPLICLALLLGGCTEEQQNRLTRLGVTWLEGEHVKSWVIHDSKVTSEPEKGYYFFWIREDGRKYYVQTPIARTYIEEIP